MTDSISAPNMVSTIAVQSYETAVPAPNRQVSLAEIGSSLNYLSKVPLHDQLFDLLRDVLRDNQLLDVSQGLLPSTRHMALALGVSRETVSKTIAKLSAHGLISATERKRTHVIEHQSQLSPNLNKIDFTPLPEPEIEKGNYENNYLIDKYRKTLRRQSTKRHKIGSNVCGLSSLRQVLASQLKLNSNIDCQPEDMVLFPDRRSCLDFILRLLSRSYTNAIVESPGTKEATSILNLHPFKTQPIGIDEFGLDVNAITNSGIKNSLALVSSTLQDPTGVSMPVLRKMDLLHWAQTTCSLLIDHGPPQGFRRSIDSPALWQLSGGIDVICIWEFASVLKPWSQICCALFPKRFMQEVRQLKSIIGAEVSINEQIAMHEFIEEGDLAKTLKHRELLCLEKRRRLNLAFSRLFSGSLSVMPINKGPKMVFDLSGETNLAMIVEAAQRVDLPASRIDIASSDDQSAKLLLDLDMVALESLSEKIQAFECVLDVYKSRLATH